MLEIYSIFMLVAVLVISMVLYNLYAGVIKSKNKVKEAFSSIDVQLKKRYDLIPNILTIANKFMEHERGLLEEVTKLRVQAMGVSNDLSQTNKKFELDKLINAKLGQITVAMENYPQLKSDATMTQAMSAFQDTEEHIAAARRFYNSAVNDLNNKVEIFPSSIFAAMCNIQAQPFFEADEVSRKSINASDYLK
ncbi:MAG: LemA family protein [Candidatus Gastranaerophilales bacterium]|nr:LemA family protein [Candidatus Gastranaerophilales bacterium]